MRLTTSRALMVNRFVARALVAALGLAGCGGHAVLLTMNDGEEAGTVHGQWQFGRPMWMVMPVPSFNHSVRVTDLRFQTVSGLGTIDGTDAQLLVLPAGPYRGLTLSYQLDTSGGHL